MNNKKAYSTKTYQIYSTSVNCTIDHGDPKIGDNDRVSWQSTRSPAHRANKSVRTGFTQRSHDGLHLHWLRRRNKPVMGFLLRVHDRRVRPPKVWTQRRGGALPRENSTGRQVYRAHGNTREESVWKGAEISESSQLPDRRGGLWEAQYSLLVRGEVPAPTEECEWGRRRLVVDCTKGSMGRPHRRCFLLLQLIARWSRSIIYIYIYRGMLSYTDVSTKCCETINIVFILYLISAHDWCVYI